MEKLRDHRERGVLASGTVIPANNIKVTPERIDENGFASKTRGKAALHGQLPHPFVREGFRIDHKIAAGGFTRHGSQKGLFNIELIDEV